MNRVGERIARAMGIVALGLALILAVGRTLWPNVAVSRPNPASLRIDAGTGDSAVSVARAVAALLIDDAIPQRRAEWPSLTMRMQTIPGGGVRAVLGAARRAGMPLRWRDSTGVKELALDASGVPMPRVSTLIAAAGAVTPDSAATYAFTVRDAGGLLDSVAGVTAALRVRAARLQGAVRAQLQRNGRTVASAIVPVPTSAPIRRVMIVARPGWETKFVTAALEESGWAVDGTLTVSPTSRIRLGSPGTLDTVRYSAAVVLDSGVASGQSLRRFVGQGGGVVMSGEALRDPALYALMPARVTDDRAAIAGALLSDEPRRGLAAYRLRGVPTAIILEHEDSTAAMVVARRGMGRVLASGYRSTWRWRMEGREGSADDHRRWWNALVSAVAFAPMVAMMDTTGGDPDAIWPGDAAPVADLVARIGTPFAGASIPSSPHVRAAFPEWLLFAIAGVALLTEWALRRLRGAP